ncbi:MAG: GNAT family N-acetyltransferase [Prosthecobacter sp.]|nr:GNAT family N-acetyltransferase [Prosthecobacter sp.]
MNNPPEFLIRLAQRTDLDSLVALEALFSYDRVSRRSFRRMIGSESAEIWLAESTGELGILGNFILFTRKGSKTARFYSLMVAPAARRKGVGKALFEKAEASVLAKGCRFVCGEVRTDNHASRAMLARFGYTEAEPLPGYYDDGADGIRVRKCLG